MHCQAPQANPRRPGQAAGRERQNHRRRPAACGEHVYLKTSSEITNARKDDVSADILPRVAAGDPRAADELMDRYGALIWSLARRHTRRPADAEDAVQEIFLALWKNAGRFDSGRASEPTFITMIARRRLIDLHRYKTRRPQTDGAEADLETLTDLRAGEIEVKAEAKLASRALDVLKPKEREVVLLSTYQGMSHSEIAAHVDMPLGTVKTYIRRGLMRVREALEQPRRAPEGTA